MSRSNNSPLVCCLRAYWRQGIAFEISYFRTFKPPWVDLHLDHGSVTHHSYIGSWITHQPQPAYQILFKSVKMFCGCTQG